MPHSVAINYYRLSTRLRQSGRLGFLYTECDGDLLNAAIHLRRRRFRYSRSIRRKFQRKTTTRDYHLIRSPSYISCFFSPTGWNVNRGRDILQRGHGVRAWNQFKSCSPRRDRKARERGSFANLICTHLARKPIPLPVLLNLDFYFAY